MKEDDVVVVSSDSEEDEEIVWMRKNQNKQYQLLSEKIKPILYYQVQPGYKLSTSFPYARFQELANDLKKSLALVNAKSTQAFIWKNLIRWLVSIKLCYENVSDCINDRNYNLILTDFMAQYVNYKCKLYSTITDETEVTLVSNEIVVTLSLVFSGWVPGILMTLLKIQVIDDYRLILYPIFKKYLSNKHLHKNNDLISYLRLILCFRKWKKLAHFKEDKEIINEIAVGKSAKALRCDIIDLSTETASEPVLPKTVPSINEDNRCFANITGLIGFAAKNLEYGTRILLINKTLELDDTIEQFFKHYYEYINRSTPKLLECSKVGHKPILIEDLTRSPSPDQLLPRTSCATRETSQIVNKNKCNGKQGTKAVNQHLSIDCDISSISVNNKFNNLNLNSHTNENLSPSCKNIPHNRKNDVVLSLGINNVVDIVDTNDDDDNNENDTCVLGKNSNANSMNAFEKRIAGVIDSLKNRAISVGDLISRVNVERINNPVPAAISLDEAAQTNAESPVVQAVINNVVAPIPNPAPMRAAANPPNEVPVEKPIRKRHGIVSSTTSFEGTGNDSDNSDDDYGFGAHNRFPFSQRSFYKVVEEATSSTNEIPKTPSYFSNQPRRSISSSPCPTRASSPSPDRRSNISPSSTITSGCLSRLGISSGTSTTNGRSVSSIADEEQPTCSRYVAMPVLGASLPHHEDTSKKDKVQDPSPEKLKLKDQESTTSTNIIECSASETDSSKHGEDKCKNVSEVDTNTCSVNELLKNISGFIGELQEEDGFESTKNKCGPDKSPAVLSETNPTIVEEITKSSDISFEEDVEQQLKALKNVTQQTIVLPDVKNDSKNVTEITTVKNSREKEKDLNDENEKESFIDKPVFEEPNANSNDPESDTEKTPTKDEVYKTKEHDNRHDEQSRELVSIKNCLKSINEEITNKIYLTGVYSNIRHEEIIEKIQIEQSKPVADDENLFEAFVEEESSSMDDIESPAYEPICQNERLDFPDNEEKLIENVDSMKTSEQMVPKNTKTIDEPVKSNSAENKDDSSEKTADIELNKTKFENIKCQPQRVEVENKLKTKEKVIINVSQNHSKSTCMKIIEEEKTVLTEQTKAKNENINENQPKIFVKTVELNQKQLNVKNLQESNENKKLQIEKIINYDHDYVTVKYSVSSENDRSYEKLKNLQNFDDNSKACSPTEFSHRSEASNCSNQILETCNANTICSKQENTSNDGKANEINKSLKVLEKEGDSFENQHDKINESTHDLTVTYDTILATSQSDVQQDQNDRIAKQLTSIQKAEDDDVNSNTDQLKHINFSVNNDDEAIEKQTYDDEVVNEDQIFKVQNSYNESFIDKALETLENLAYDNEEIVVDQCVTRQSTVDNKLEKDKDDEKNKEPLNTSELIDQMDEVIEQEAINDITINKNQCSDNIIISVDSELVAKDTVNVNIKNEKKNKKESQNISQAIDQKETFDVKNIDENQSVTKETTIHLNLNPSGSKFNREHEVNPINRDETKDQATITSIIVFPAIQKTNKEKIVKENTDANKINEDHSVIQQLSSDKISKAIATGFDDENVLKVATKNDTNNMELLTKNHENPEIAEEKTSNITRLNRTVTPNLNKLNVEKETENVSYKEELNKISSFDQIEEATQKQIINIKELQEEEVTPTNNTKPQESLSLFDQKEEPVEKQSINIKKDKVTQIKIQKINETTADPLKLPPAIKHEVAFHNTKPQESRPPSDQKEEATEKQINASIQIQHSNETTADPLKLPPAKEHGVVFQKTKSQESRLSFDKKEEATEKQINAPMQIQHSNETTPDPLKSPPAIEHKVIFQITKPQERLPLFDKKEEIIEKQSIDIKKDKVTQIKIQKINETTADPLKSPPVIQHEVVFHKTTSQESRPSFDQKEEATEKQINTTMQIQHSNETTADPLKLPPAIEHEVVFQNTKPQNTDEQEKRTEPNHEREYKMEIIVDEIRDSLSSTKNVPKMQESSSSSTNNCLEVLTTEIKTPPLPPKLVSSLTPSSESLNKNQLSQSLTINNEAALPLKHNSRRKVIVRIAKLPILEKKLLKKKKRTSSGFKIVNLEETVTNVEHSDKYQITTEENISKKNVLKKDKSSKKSKKSERKKIKKAKQNEALLSNICEEEVRESINLPIKEETIQVPNQKTAIEENADKKQYEKKNSTECKAIVKEKSKETNCELSAVGGEKICSEISTKKKKNSKNKPKHKLKLFEEEKIQKLSKTLNNSKLLTDDHFFKLDALECFDHQRIVDKKSSNVKEKNDQIIFDEDVAAMDTELNDSVKDKKRMKRKKSRGHSINQNNESTKKPTFDAKHIDEDQLVIQKVYPKENASGIDIDCNGGDETEIGQKNPLNKPSHKDEAIKKWIVGVAKTHEDNSDTNLTPNEDKSTADDNYLENRDKISTAIEQNVALVNENAEETFIKDSNTDNCQERDDKIEKINDEIHISLNSTNIFPETQKSVSPSTKVVDNYSEIQTKDVKSLSLSPKAEDFPPFKEQRTEKEKKKETSSSESLDKSGPLHSSPTKDDSVKKLIIRIPKMSVLRSAEEASVSSLKSQKHLKIVEHSDKCELIQETSSKKVLKNNKSSKKSDEEKMKPKKLKAILKTTSIPEEDVSKLDASECIRITTENENTAIKKYTNNDQFDICNPKASTENLNEDKSSAKKDLKETASELSLEGVEKPKKKKKSVTFEIEGTIYKREHSSQLNIFEEQVKEPIKKPTKDLKLSTKEQKVRKVLTDASIELGDVKRVLDESDVNPPTIEDNTICRKSDTKSKKARTNKSKLRLNKKKNEIDELIQIPMNNLKLSHGEDQVNKSNASEIICSQVDIKKTDTEKIVLNGQSEKNKPIATVDNVTERKPFVKDILEKSAAKKNTATSIEISKINNQQEAHQNLFSKVNIETSTEEPILKKTKESSTLSISKPSTDIQILQRPKSIDDIVKASTKDMDTEKLLPRSVIKAVSLDSFVKSVKYAECQTEPKSKIREEDQLSSRKCRKLSDTSSTSQLNPIKWETNILQNIVQCKDELIKNRNQEVFSQIRHAQLNNSIEPDSSSQVATELERTENTLTEEESNLSTRVQVADLGEPSLISDSEVSQQNVSVALESDKSIVFYPSRDSIEDQEVSCITSLKNDNIYYGYSDDKGTPVMDEKNSTDDEFPPNQYEIISLNKVSDLISQKPQFIEPITKPIPEPKEPEPIPIDNVKECNVGPDESITSFWGAADENLELLWLKKLDISKNIPSNRCANSSYLNSTKVVENSLENQKNDRKQKKPQRVEKDLNYEDFNAAAILTSFKDCQQKLHRSRKGLQPTRITRSGNHTVEADSFLQHDPPQKIVSPIICSENLCEKKPLDNLNIIEKCKSPSAIQNHNELTQSNVSSDSDDIGKLVIDLDVKKIPKPKTKEKPKSKKNKNRKAKGITSSKTALKKNTKAINQEIVNIIDDDDICVVKKSRGRPKVSKDSPTKNSQAATTETQSMRETGKQKKKEKIHTKSLDNSKAPTEKDEQVEKKSLQKNDKLRLSVDIPLGIPKEPKLIEKRNEEPRTSSNIDNELSTCIDALDNMSQETWLKNFTLRKTSKSLDLEVKHLSENVSSVKKILSEQNLLLTSKTDVGFLNIKSKESGKVSDILIEPNKTKDDQNKSKHDIQEVTEVATITNLKESVIGIEKQMKPLKTSKQQKEEKLNKCIRRLSIEEKHPKKPKIDNEVSSILEDQTASVATPTIHIEESKQNDTSSRTVVEVSSILEDQTASVATPTIHIEESKQNDTSSKTVVEPSPNSIHDLAKHSELVSENIIVTIPETSIEENVVTVEEKPKQIEEIKKIEKPKSVDKTLTDTVEKSTLNEVENHCKTTPQKVKESTEEAINKIVDLMEAAKNTTAISSKVSTLNEEHMNSNKDNSEEKPKTYKRKLNFDSPLSSDPLSSTITNTPAVDEIKKVLVTPTDEGKLKSSVLSNDELEATISIAVPEKHQSKSSCDILEKNKILDEQGLLDKRFKRRLLDSHLTQSNISTIERDAKNLIEFAQVSKSVKVKTPDKKEVEEVETTLDNSIEYFLRTKGTSTTDSDPNNIIAEEVTKQKSDDSIVKLASKDNNHQSSKLDNEQTIKKSVETFSERKSPSLNGVQGLVNVSVFHPITLPSESTELESFEKEQETLKNKSESKAKKSRVLSLTSFLEDFYLDELNVENFNDTREDQSNQVPVPSKAEPASLDCMLSGNRGQDDEYNLNTFTHLALQPVPTYSPDENVDNLFSLDDFCSLLPTSSLISQSENVSGSNSESGEKIKPDTKKIDFTTKEVETEKAPFDEGKTSTINENQTIDVRTSDYELNNCTTNVSSADVILMNPPTSQIISCQKIKTIKSPLIKKFHKTTPEKKNLTEEVTESILESKLKSRQKPFWKPKVVEESSESTKLDTSTFVISPTENPYSIDDVPVYFDKIFEEKHTKIPFESENIVTETVTVTETETNLYKIDLGKKVCLDNISTDDRFDQIKKEAPVNTLKPASSHKKSNVALDEPTSQSISINSSISSISSAQMCEQKDEANKTISLIDENNLYSNNSSHSVKTTASYKQIDETKKSVIEPKPGLVETKKTCEKIVEADDLFSNTVLHACSNTYSKKRQSRIPSVKNSPEIVNVSQISVKNTYSNSNHLTSKTLSSVTAVSSLSSISTSKTVDVPVSTVLAPCEQKISVKTVSPKISIEQNLVIQTSDKSEKINPTQSTTENKNLETFKLCLKEDPLLSDAKKELLSKVLCPKKKSLATQTPDQLKNINPIQTTRSEISTRSVSVQVVSSKSSVSVPVVSSKSSVSIPNASSLISISKSSVAPRILNRCDIKIVGKSASTCSKTFVGQTFVIKTINPSEKINKIQPAPQNNTIASSKPSLKRHSPLSDDILVQEPPSKILCSEISKTSVPIAVVSSMPSISTSSVTSTILNPSEPKISVKTSHSKQPVKQYVVIKTPASTAKINSIQSTVGNKNVKGSEPSLKISHSHVNTSSPNASYGIGHTRNQTITKPAMLESTSSVIPPVSLPAQSPKTSRTIPHVNTSQKAISFTYRKSTPSSTPGKSGSEKPRSTPNPFDTPRSNNKPSSTPKSTPPTSSASAVRTPNSLSADLARLSADLELIKKEISQLPEIDYEFRAFKHRKSLLEKLKTKQEELNEFKKRHQEHVQHNYVLKSHSERKPFDRDHKPHHQQQYGSSLQQSGMKRKYDQLRPHSEHQFSKSSTSSHSSHVQRQKHQNRVYVNKFSELDKLHFINKNNQPADTKPEAKKLPPWDPKPCNADDIIRSLRSK